jgi:hypothetical protein
MVNKSCICWSEKLWYYRGARYHNKNDFHPTFTLRRPAIVWATAQRQAFNQWQSVMDQMPHTNLPFLRHSLLLSSSFQINISLKWDMFGSPWIIRLQVRQATVNANVRRLLLLSDLNSLPPWMGYNAKTCWRNELTWLQDSCPFQISGGTRRHTLPPSVARVAVSAAHRPHPARKPSTPTTKQNRLKEL